MVSIKWQPEPQDLLWTTSLLKTIRDGGVWVIPATGQAFQISHAERTLTLIRDPGHPDGPEMYSRIAAVLEKLGWRAKKLESKC